MNTELIASQTKVLALSESEARNFIIIPKTKELAVECLRIRPQGGRNKELFVPCDADLSPIEMLNFYSSPCTIFPCIGEESASNPFVGLLLVVCVHFVQELAILRNKLVLEDFTAALDLVDLHKKPVRCRKLQTPPTSVLNEEKARYDQVRFQRLGGGVFNDPHYGLNESDFNCTPDTVALNFINELTPASFVQFLDQTRHFTSHLTKSDTRVERLFL